jgi:hypothetical protein
LDEWPELPYEGWQKTRDTLHMYTQVIGKLRLALSPFEPQWANVPLYVSVRGLTTSPIPVDLRTFDAELDLIEHVLVMRSSDGRVDRRPLGGSVAEFYADVMSILRRMDIDVSLSVVPSEVSNPIPFPDDRTHDTYDPAQATRFHRVLSMIAVVMREHRARFRGRTSPVQFFWGTFDLALLRFSGKRVEPPADAGTIMRYGGDAEAICVGWWPGDERSPAPAFFAYGYPAPEGIATVRVEPAAGAWIPTLGEFLLPYDAVRGERDPRRAILDFLESTYTGAAGLMGWDPDLTHVDAPPR